MRELILQLIESASAVVLDKKQEIRLAVTCLLAGGHLLIEDVPGVGKTTLVQTLSKLSGLKSNRIQFTIDLLPADILGSMIFNSTSQEFQFKPGPIFAQMVLADELNRASPRTQGALLQAMEENQVSMDGTTHELPLPFYVIATQNPNQQLGTFPLPESQLDRFLMSIELNYASTNTEIDLFRGESSKSKIGSLKPLMSAADFALIQIEVSKIQVSEVVAKYVSAILQTSRVKLNECSPLSTRAGLSLVRAAKAWAYLDNRNYLRPEDIQAVLAPVTSHRLGGNYGLRKGREWSERIRNETSVPF